MKKDFITAFIYFYGGTKKEAADVFKKASADVIEAIIDGWKTAAKQAFNYD